VPMNFHESGKANSQTSDGEATSVETRMGSV
jgi:hypothetical protein